MIGDYEQVNKSRLAVHPGKTKCWTILLGGTTLNPALEGNHSGSTVVQSVRTYIFL